MPYPRLVLNKRWGAEPTNEDRLTVNSFINKLGGETLEERINRLESFLEGCKEDCIRETNIPQAIASIVVLDALASLVFDFNARPAGDLFEAFLAALTGGIQTGQRGGLADVGEALSAKLIRKGTDVEGSYRNLIAFLEEDRSINYLVAAKVQEGRDGPLVVEFYKFNIPEQVDLDEVQRKGTKFVVPPEVYEREEFKIATLNIGTQQNLRSIAEEYLNNLDNRVATIYETLGTLSNELNKYFVENETNSARRAESSATELKANIAKLA